MAKTKSTKKRTVSCGKCKGEGHNARTCPEKAVALAVKEPVAAPTPPAPTPAPPVQKKTKIDTREDRRKSTVPKREAPTADMGTAATAAPFRCGVCNQVAILVIVRVVDHVASHKQGKTIYKGETRCERCMNKPNPSDLILKWGALPGEKISPEEING